MVLTTPWQDLHRWADDGGRVSPARKMRPAMRRQQWLRRRAELDAIRRESGRNIDINHGNRRLEASR